MYPGLWRTGSTAGSAVSHLFLPFLPPAPPPPPLVVSRGWTMVEVKKALTIADTESIYSGSGRGDENSGGARSVTWPHRQRERTGGGGRL